MKTILSTALILGLIGSLHGQDATRTVKVDDFEAEASDWAAFKLDETGINADPDSKATIVRESGQVKAGKGALSYTYEVTPKTMRVLGIHRALDLTGMKSLRLWVKCSTSTAVIIGLSEAGGASYQAAAYCPAGVWQEVAVNLDELTPDDPAKDANGKLDLDQVGSINVFDIGGFLATFLPDLKGSRQMWLDDIAFSSKAVTLTTGRTQQTRVVPVHLVDSFETPVVRWLAISLEFSDPPRFNLFDAPVAVDADVPAGGGKQSLKFAYPRKGMKFHGIMRSLDKVDLGPAVGLDLCLKTSADGTFVVTVEEKDGSRYQKIIELKAGDGWKQLNYGLADLTLADDSQDDNGKLDASEIKQISIGDITTLTGGGEADEVRLWVDQVLFVLAP